MKGEQPYFRVNFRQSAQTRMRKMCFFDFLSPAFSSVSFLADCCLFVSFCLASKCLLTDSFSHLIGTNVGPVWAVSCLQDYLCRRPRCANCRDSLMAAAPGHQRDFGSACAQPSGWASGTTGLILQLGCCCELFPLEECLAPSTISAK